MFKKGSHEHGVHSVLIQHLFDPTHKTAQKSGSMGPQSEKGTVTHHYHRKYPIGKAEMSAITNKLKQEGHSRGFDNNWYHRDKEHLIKLERAHPDDATGAKHGLNLTFMHPRKNTMREEIINELHVVHDFDNEKEVVAAAKKAGARRTTVSLRDDDYLHSHFRVPNMGEFSKHMGKVKGASIIDEEIETLDEISLDKLKSIHAGLKWNDRTSEEDYGRDDTTDRAERMKRKIETHVAKKYGISPKDLNRSSHQMGNKMDRHFFKTNQGFSTDPTPHEKKPVRKALHWAFVAQKPSKRMKDEHIEDGPYDIIIEGYKGIVQKHIPNVTSPNLLGHINIKDGKPESDEDHAKLAKAKEGGKVRLRWRGKHEPAVSSGEQWNDTPKKNARGAAIYRKEDSDLAKLFRIFRRNPGKRAQGLIQRPWGPLWDKYHTKSAQWHSKRAQKLYGKAADASKPKGQFASRMTSLADRHSKLAKANRKQTVAHQTRREWMADILKQHQTKKKAFESNNEKDFWYDYNDPKSIRKYGARITKESPTDRRQREIRNHKFSSNIGGHDANYRKEEVIPKEKQAEYGKEVIRKGLEARKKLSTSSAAWLKKQNDAHRKPYREDVQSEAKVTAPLPKTSAHKSLDYQIKRFLAKGGKISKFPLRGSEEEKRGYYGTVKKDDGTTKKVFVPKKAVNEDVRPPLSLNDRHKRKTTNFLRNRDDDIAKRIKQGHSNDKIAGDTKYHPAAINAVRGSMNESPATVNYKVGDIVDPIVGPHKNHPHKVIHVHDSGHLNITPVGLRKGQNRYHLGAAKAEPSQVVPNHNYKKSAWEGLEESNLPPGWTQEKWDAQTLDQKLATLKKLKTQHGGQHSDVSKALGRIFSWKKSKTNGKV